MATGGLAIHVHVREFGLTVTSGSDQSGSLVPPWRCVVEREEFITPTSNMLLMTKKSLEA